MVYNKSNNRNESILHPQIYRTYTLPQTSKKIIEDLSEQLKGCDQTPASYILTLNTFHKANENSVQFNKKNGSYIFGNYYIVPGYMKQNSDFFDNLRFLNRAGYCRTSAPELVDIIQTPDKNFGVVIYKINDTKGGILEPYREVAHEIPIEKKERFLEEQITLLKSTALYNPAITESQDAWGVTTDTKNIYVDSWSQLVKSKSTQERQDLINKIRYLLK